MTEGWVLTFLNGMTYTSAALLWAAITVFHNESRPQLPERAAAFLVAEITRKY